MKKYLLLMSIMVCGTVLAKSPKMFLNGEKFDGNRYLISTKSMQSIDVDTDKKYIYIESTKTPIQYVALTELLKDRRELKQVKPGAVYIVNKKFYDNISQLMVDKAYQGLSIGVSTINDNKHIKSKYHHKELVTITLNNNITN